MKKKSISLCSILILLSIINIALLREKDENSKFNLHNCSSIAMAQAESHEIIDPIIEPTGIIEWFQKLFDFNYSD